MQHLYHHQIQGRASHVCNWKAIFAINSSVIVDIAWVYVFVSHTYHTVVRADDAEGLYLMDLQHCECDTFTAYKNLGRISGRKRNETFSLSYTLRSPYFVVVQVHQLFTSIKSSFWYIFTSLINIWHLCLNLITLLAPWKLWKFVPFIKSVGKVCALRLLWINASIFCEETESEN